MAMKNIWHDPVWSKVIAGIILTIIGAIFTYVIQTNEQPDFSEDSINSKKKSVSAIEYKNTKAYPNNSIVVTNQPPAKIVHPIEKNTSSQNEKPKFKKKSGNTLGDSDDCLNSNPDIECLWK